MATSEQKQELCSLCGRLFLVSELVWSCRQQAVVCPGCLAEEEGCGCEDE